MAVRPAQRNPFLLVRDFHLLLSLHRLLHLLCESVIFHSEVEGVANNTGTGVEATTDDFAFPRLAEDASALQTGDGADFLTTPPYPSNR